MHLADLHSVSSLVEVINCAHMTNTRVMKPSTSQTGGQDKMAKAKGMLCEFVMTSEHLITFYRVGVSCSVRQTVLRSPHQFCPCGFTPNYMEFAAALVSQKHHSLEISPLLR